MLPELLQSFLQPEQTKRNRLVKIDGAVSMAGSRRSAMGPVCIVIHGTEVISGWKCRHPLKQPMGEGVQSFGLLLPRLDQQRSLRS